MTDGGSLMSAWRWDVPSLLACATLLAAYATLTRGRRAARRSCFAGGVLVLLLALLSPLATLARLHLFSAHMLQHILLVLVVPPLCILGLPPAARKSATGRRFPPVLGWLSGVTAMWIWHFPPLFNAALRSPALHAVEHLSLLVMGAAFWWPVLAPRAQSRVAPLSAVLYLFLSCVACSVLGILLAFAPLGLYHAPSHDGVGALAPLRAEWGLSPAADQQIGGLLMWVPCCLIYVTASLGVLARWYAAPEGVEFSPAMSLANE